MKIRLILSGEFCQKLSNAGYKVKLKTEIQVCIFWLTFLIDKKSVCQLLAESAWDARKNEQAIISVSS